MTAESEGSRIPKQHSCILYEVGNVSAAIQDGGQARRLRRQRRLLRLHSGGGGAGTKHRRATYPAETAATLGRRSVPGSRGG